MDAITKRWIKNASDERAAAYCRFDERRAQHVVTFFEKYLRFYEGRGFAGKPFIPLDWQVDVLMRTFGWVRPSEHWGREVRRFRKASIFVPKKNGKSPLGAGVGLYLLTSDREPGQKVFSAARDGKQAFVMHRHAMRMTQLSPVLSRCCKVHQGTGLITFEDSTYAILAGDNINSQEGLNGSVIIDETHVVDERLAGVLEYMGASRAEALQFEISTAGNNPEGYGRRQYEYGKSVERGDFLDDEFLFVAYEAPADTTDSDIESKPEIWRLANPSWGRTINEEEFRTTLTRAKRSLTDWNRFKMYRLNLWQESANPWLRQDDWAKCAKAFSAKDLEGRDCWLGLDLSKTRDMTSAVLVFPDDECFWQLPFFWMPEEEAKSKNHLAPFLDWASQGHLDLTPGNSIDYGAVEDRIGELSKKFNIQGIAFDKTYANELTQRLEDQYAIPRFRCPLNWQAYAAMTAEYERLVVSGKLYHPGNPILNWQAGHIQVKTDNNQNKKPMKPPHNDHRKIDGMCAGMMGLYAAITQPDTASVYEQKGAVFAC